MLHPPPLGFDFSDASARLSHPVIALGLPGPPANHIFILRCVWITNSHSHVRTPSAPFIQRPDEDILAAHFWFRCSDDSEMCGWECKYHKDDLSPPQAWLVVPKPVLLRDIDRAEASPASAEWGHNARHLPWTSWGSEAGVLESHICLTSTPIHGPRLITHYLNAGADSDSLVNIIRDFRRLPLQKRNKAQACETYQATAYRDLSHNLPHKRAPPPLPTKPDATNENSPKSWRWMKLLATGDYFVVAEKCVCNTWHHRCYILLMIWDILRQLSYWWY